MPKPDVLYTDTVVIGAGVVGLAVAAELAWQGRDVVVVESADRFGEGVSSRNSEVIHAGIYYTENSLKARLCVEGRQQLYDYCRRHKVAHRKTGKWIIASGHEGQDQTLEALHRQAELNGVALTSFTGKQVRQALPDVVASAALYSAETGIVDSHGLMLALLGDLEDYGGQLVCRAPVESVYSDSRGHHLRIGGDSPCELVAGRVVNSAGLEAVPLSRRWEGLAPEHSPDQWYARGVYFSYAGRHPFGQLIYPVPEPGGLGVHLTLDLAGQARFGPDVEWIDVPDYSVDPSRITAFVESIGKWWPELDRRRLQPAYAGIRPKLAGPGENFADFRIDGEAEHGLPGVVQLFGIESPGLTSCLAIARLVARKLD